MHGTKRLTKPFRRERQPLPDRDRRGLMTQPKSKYRHE